MPYPSNASVQALLSDLNGFRNRRNKVSPEELRPQLEVLVARAARLGIRSAYLLHEQSMLLAALDQPERALELAAEAGVLEPLHLAIQQQFTELSLALRESLPLERDPARVRRVYALLSRYGETDVASHLAYAAVLHAAGETAEAERLVQAMLLLAPASADVWRKQARFLDAKGDAEGALAAEAEALRRTDGTQPYGIPSPKERC